MKQTKAIREHTTAVEGAVCPVPIVPTEKIVLGHGSGGRLTQTLIQTMFYSAFGNPILLQGDDAAVVVAEGKTAVSTDSHIISPIFFPGGDIGRLAVCGTVNDLAMMGARPDWMTAGFILEEGLPLSDLEEVVNSMQSAAKEAGVKIIAGDTKVAERGKVDRIFINTTGAGQIPQDREVSGRNAREGDAVLVSGTLGDHGIAVLAARGELDFETELVSDVAPLGELVEVIFQTGASVHVLRDPTRAGLAASLNEIAAQSGVCIQIDETTIPIAPAVEAACEMLGFDPLHIANEGKLVAIIPEADAEAVLTAMRKTTLGAGATKIGRVEAEPQGRVLMRTSIGGTRVVEIPAGELLPRIC
jgi:hydrogenase expression/formation protein HypE